jgi:hypothetical protein
MYRKSFLFVLVLSLVLTSVVKADLIGWWRFEEGSGDIAYDSSDYGNDGILNGNNTWVEGYFGGGLELNNSYVAIDGIADDLTENNFTVSAWIKTTMTGDGNVIGSNNDSGGHDFIWGVDGGEHLVEADSLNTYPPIINDDEWHFIAYVRDGDQAFVYTDGDLVGTETPSGNPAGQTLWSIGIEWDPPSPSDFYNGIVDDVHFFNNPLDHDQILILMKGEGFAQAARPEPKDGSYIEDTWVSLNWAPGDFAVSHDVYFSDNLADVEASAEAAFQGNQTATFLVVGFPGMPYPDGLVTGMTYYWRVDEINDDDPNSPWIGNVWSFTVPPKTAYLPDPADGGESVDPEPVLEWTPGFSAKLHTIYFGESFDEVDSAAGGLPQGATNYRPGPLKMAKTYYWRVDEFDPPNTHKGDVWSFTTEGAVEALNPANRAVDVSQTPVLTWAPGFGASHEVYFGADAGALELKASGDLGAESYEPGQLEWNTTYYWRVDEVNSANADSPWTGPLWSFTTANFLIIDDIESYNDIPEGEPASNRIYNAWLDGYDDPTNGSQTGHLDPPFYEETIVHSGNKSMPIYYDNAVGKSESTLTLTSNNDWTIKGVDTLTIWHRGSNNNAAETMYVTLNGSATVDNDNPEAARSPRWTEWNIPLQAFADQGINLSNVTSITLGLRSVTGGTGMLIFDDIRLYPPAQ